MNGCQDVVEPRTEERSKFSTKDQMVKELKFTRESLCMRVISPMERVMDTEEVLQAMEKFIKDVSKLT